MRCGAHALRRWRRSALQWLVRRRCGRAQCHSVSVGRARRSPCSAAQDSMRVSTRTRMRTAPSTRTRTHKHKRAHTHMHKHRHTRGDGTEKLSARACCVQQCHAHTQAGYPRKRRRRRGAIQSRAQQRHARRGGRSGAACCLLHVVCCMSSVACRLLHAVCCSARTMSRPIRCWFKNRDGWLTEAEPSCLRGFSSRITSRRARPARSAGCTEEGHGEIRDGSEAAPGVGVRTGGEGRKVCEPLGGDGRGRKFG